VTRQTEGNSRPEVQTSAVGEQRGDENEEVHFIGSERSHRHRGSNRGEFDGVRCRRDEPHDGLACEHGASTILQAVSIRSLEASYHLSLGVQNRWRTLHDEPEWGAEPDEDGLVGCLQEELGHGLYVDVGVGLSR
jgi:hypothetical protein